MSDGLMRAVWVIASSMFVVAVYVAVGPSSIWVDGIVIEVPLEGVLDAILDMLCIGCTRDMMWNGYEGRMQTFQLDPALFIYDYTL
jgi:hypothetical protein